MIKLLREWFSERDNQTMCVVRVLAFVGACIMLYKFYILKGASFEDFGTGFSLILAAVVAKNFTEGKK